MSQYTKYEWDLMFTFDMAAYVRQRNADSLPTDQLPEDPEWLSRWTSAYHLEKDLAAERLAAVLTRNDPNSVKRTYEHLTLAQVEKAINCALDLQAEMEHLRAEEEEKRAERAAETAAAENAARLERVELGVEDPRPGDYVEEWVRLEIVAEQLGWGDNASYAPRRPRKRGEE